MKLRHFLLTLLLAFSLTAGMVAPASADAAVEEFWYYAYEVDKTIVVNAKDGQGLYMRYGAGTEYDKVNQQLIPMGTKLHIIQETTDSRGWKWGYTAYAFPGEEWTDEGWVCLVETYEVTNAPAQTQETPEEVPPEEPAAEEVPEAIPDPETSEAEEPAAEEAAPEEAPAAEGSSMTSSLMLVGIGVVIGVVVLTALLLLLRKKK